MIIRARQMLTLSEPALIENAAVRVHKGIIAEVGSWNQIDVHDPDVLDLGEVILLPGLINAHCHLDYTSMAGQIPPQKNFPDWIMHLISCKSALNDQGILDSWKKGAKMLLQSGTTTVLDIESFPALLSEAWSTTPLRMVSFLELIHTRNDMPTDATIQRATAYLKEEKQGLKSMALSPHAPYSTTPSLLQKAGDYCHQHNRLLAIHVSESSEEFDMFTRRSGPMWDWLAHQRNMDDCKGSSPVEHLHAHGILSDSCMAVHANVVTEKDIALLANHHVTVTHCPGSHAYFNHPPFPFESFQNHKVNLCLGTDSLASMPSQGKAPPVLNLFDEMRRFAITHPGVDPSVILAMCTVNPARYLQKKVDLGKITAGSCADLIAVPYTSSLRDSIETVVHDTVQVIFSMIHGVKILCHE